MTFSLNWRLLLAIHLKYTRWSALTCCAWRWFSLTHARTHPHLETVYSRYAYFTSPMLNGFALSQSGSSFATEAGSSCALLFEKLPEIGQEQSQWSDTEIRDATNLVHQNLQRLDSYLSFVVSGFLLFTFVFFIFKCEICLLIFNIVFTFWTIVYNSTIGEKACMYLHTQDGVVICLLSNGFLVQPNSCLCHLLSIFSSQWQCQRVGGSIKDIEIICMIGFVNPRSIYLYWSKILAKKLWTTEVLAINSKWRLWWDQDLLYWSHN